MCVRFFDDLKYCILFVEQFPNVYVSVVVLSQAEVIASDVMLSQTQVTANMCSWSEAELVVKSCEKMVKGFGDDVELLIVICATAAQSTGANTSLS